MKTLYIECNMGIAGDMLCGALLDMLSSDEKKSAINVINNLGIDTVAVTFQESIKCGITGTKFNVEIQQEHHNHTSITEIYDIIDSLKIDDKTKADAKAVYSIIADAESIVHTTSVADVHLHEVGAKDAIVDIVSACYLINQISPDRIISSPITTGFGSVHTAHGIMSVPAPATALILKDIPIKSGNIESELCTPTGASLIKYFADEITTDTQLTIKKTGYGMGKKDFDTANCVRVFLSESNEQSIYELKCQIDDMTGEEMGYAIEKMISLGVNDAFVQSIIMKKTRPAMLFTVICEPDKKDYFTQQIFKHTTTLGIRQIKCTRAVLSREIIEQGGVHIKRSSGYGTTKEKPEFDDIARIADEKDISIFEAIKSTK